MAERAKAKKASAKKAPKGAQGSRGKVAKTDKPGVGHNSGKVSAALVKDHHDKICAIETRLAAAKTKYDSVKGELRAAFAVVKQDGIQVDDFKLARELDKRDHGSVVVGYANTGEYLSAIKSELATQLELFQGLTIPEAAHPGLAGTQAFNSGNDRSTNPFQQGTPEYVDFDNAWMAAAKEKGLTDGDGATIN